MRSQHSACAMASRGLLLGRLFLPLVDQSGPYSAWIVPLASVSYVCQYVPNQQEAAAEKKQQQLVSLEGKRDADADRQTDKQTQKEVVPSLSECSELGIPASHLEKVGILSHSQTRAGNSRKSFFF